jgi:outer membrane protein, heavy metal efflux system
MRSRFRTYVCVSVCAVAAAARAEELTLERALERARTQGAAAAAARLRVEEARARRRAAGAFRENPALDAAVGRRPGAAADYAVGLSQPLDLGRGGRVAEAEAALLRETASADDEVRLALRAVALAFQRGLAEGERLRIAREGEAGASELVRVAERRHAAGDVAALDVGVARAALARARADALATEARAALAHAELRALLAHDGELTLAGELVPPVADGAAAQADAAAARPDVRAAEAEVREAEAEARAARALARPQLAPSVRVERDEGTHVLWGGLTIGLPLWNRGAGEREAAAARASRLRVRAEAARRAAREEAAGAHRAYELRLAAAAELAHARALADDSEALAARSYEEGQIGLGELLLARREARELRAADVDHRQEAAAAAVELLSLAGRLR